MGELRFYRMPVDAPVYGHFGQTAGYGYPHRGTDFSPLPEGSPVYMPASESAISVWFLNDGSFGHAVCLNHVGTQWYSLYAHLSSLAVTVGQMVAPGDLLGYSGNTGLSTGPHLHWQACLSPNFPTDISQSADPLSFYHPEDEPMTPQERQEFDAMKADLAYAKSGADQAFALNQAAMNTLGSFADFQARMLGLEARMAAQEARGGWTGPGGFS